MFGEKQQLQEQFVQCKLVRKNANDSSVETVSWIPCKVKSGGDGRKVKVQRGMRIDLKENDGTWTRGWTVVSTGAVTHRVPDVRQSIKTHRKRTGDNAPKKGSPRS